MSGDMMKDFLPEQERAGRIVAAVKIEIGVLADIGEGRLVCGRFIGDRQFTVAMHPIGRLNGAVAGIARAPVRIDDLQYDAIDGMFDDRPVALGGIILASVQVRDALFVEFELVLLAIQREAATADAVGATAGRGAEIRGMEGIIGEIVETEQQGRLVAVKPEILDDCAP